MNTPLLLAVLVATCASGFVVGSFLPAATGRHPHRRERIAVASLNAAVWIALALRFVDDATLDRSYVAWSAFALFGSIVVLQSWIDVREQRLPREVTFAGIALGVVALVAAALLVGEPERIGAAALGALIAFSIIGAIYAASSAYYGHDGSFGFGDVLFAPLLGLFLGWLNPGIVVVALCFAFVLASVAAIVALATHRANAATQMPFGPFLAAAAIASIFVGQPFLDFVIGG